MTWYTAFYGSWNDANGIQRLKGTYDHEDVRARAQGAANQTGHVVTIIAERGMRLSVEKVYPQRERNEGYIETCPANL